MSDLHHEPTIGQPYVVKLGDSITDIAYVAYGDARRYVELVEHNKSIPGFNPAKLHPGTVLEIPAPDYLPMPSGIGGMRTSAGRSFKVQAAAPVAETKVEPDVSTVQLVSRTKKKGN